MSIKSAINEETGYYTPPFLANKVNRYNCPLCKTKVKLNKGEKIVSYFSHIKKENCNWYENENYKRPLKTDISISEIDEIEKQQKENESTHHKEGKILLKGLLETGYKISFVRLCQTFTPKCGGSLKIDTDMFCDNSKVEIEYHMKHNGKSIYCDVAHLVNGEVKTIYEVYHTHRTAEHNRPNNIKWADIQAGDIYDIVKTKTDISNKKISFICNREYECEECKKYNIQREEERKKREEEERRRRIEKLEMEREKQRLLDEERYKIRMEKAKQKKVEEEEAERKKKEEEKQFMLEKLEMEREKQRLLDEERDKIRIEKAKQKQIKEEEAERKKKEEEEKQFRKEEMNKLLNNFNNMIEKEGNKYKCIKNPNEFEKDVLDIKNKIR